jgi:ubiquinone biosynthesis monooxygenase Coq7
MSKLQPKRVVRRILRVDHAGEHGAVSIYTAQMVGLGTRHPDVQRWLAETLSHEKRHREAFREAMPGRAAKTCRALIVWSAAAGSWDA